MSRFLMLVLAATTFVAFGGGAQERAPENYERLLVPLLPIAGWSAPLWIHNDGTEAVDLFPIVYDCDSPSRCQREPVQPPGVAPGRTLSYFSFLSGSIAPMFMPVTPSWAGAVLYVERGKSKKLRLNLLVKDEQVPVVRESEFPGDRVSLLPISIHDAARYALRVYSLAEETDVTVKFYSLIGPGEQLEWEQRLRLTRPQAQATCARTPCPWPNVPFAPASAALFFSTANVNPWLYRIEVTNVNQSPIWAFLSETNNTTQAVRIYRPN